MKGKTERKEKQEKTELARTSCSDRDCPFHGNLKARGRSFEGIVTRKFPRRITIEFGRMIYVRKYERFKKSKTKIHARLSACFENKIKVGDIVKVQECRPLSRIIHFVVVKKIKDNEEKKLKNNERQSSPRSFSSAKKPNENVAVREEK